MTPCTYVQNTSFSYSNNHQNKHQVNTNTWLRLHPEESPPAVHEKDHRLRCFGFIFRPRGSKSVNLSYEVHELI